MRTLLALLVGTVTLVWLGHIRSHGPPVNGDTKQPVELGRVKWHRDFDKAQILAKKEKQPLLVLFQEVPG